MDVDVDVDVMFESLAVNANVATVLGSIPVRYPLTQWNLMGRQMKQC